MQALRLLPPACDKVLHLRCKDKWWSVPMIAKEKRDKVHLYCSNKNISIFTLRMLLPCLLTCLLKLPNFCALPIILPKSMWNMCPLCFNMMLSLWRSQIPRMKVATHHPAHEWMKFITACKYTEKGVSDKSKSESPCLQPSIALELSKILWCR